MESGPKSTNKPSFYQTFPSTCDPTDYWGQVRRTVNGKPIPQRQIDLIVEKMARDLDLQAADQLLDLCCGNGALTTYWFAMCRGGLGVDFSEFLVDVARSAFSRGSHERYLLGSVVDFVKRPTEEYRFTKAICYGSVQYLLVDEVTQLLAGLREHHPGLQRLVLGNLPDRERVSAFQRPGVQVDLDDPESAVGRWWARAELNAVARNTGWRMVVSTMPEEFYASHYRFDALLTPEGG